MVFRGRHAVVAPGANAGLVASAASALLVIAPSTAPTLGDVLLAPVFVIAAGVVRRCSSDLAAAPVSGLSARTHAGVPVAGHRCAQHVAANSSARC